MTGLQLCAHFAKTPNSLKYCGKESAEQKIEECILNGNCNGLDIEFVQFKALYAYLQLYSHKFKISPFSIEAVEAYWIGSDLSLRFDRKDFKILMKYLLQSGVPDFFIQSKIEEFEKANIPFIPTHVFNVLFIGVGNVTGSVKYNLANINNCIPQFGTVLEINHNVVIESEKLIYDKHILTLKKFISTYPLNRLFFPTLKINDNVVLHWKEISMILDQKYAQDLKKYTSFVLHEIAHIS